MEFVVAVAFIALLGGTNEGIIQFKDNPPRVELHKEFIEQGVPEYNLND